MTNSSSLGSRRGKWPLLALIVIGILAVAVLPLRKFYLNQEVVVSVQDLHGSPHQLHMSRKDKKRLDHFFRVLVIQDAFAYTFIGIKPMSFTTLWGKSLKLGWKTWLKYRDLLETDRLDFWEEESSWKDNPWLRNKREIYLVDSALVQTTIFAHQRDFQGVLRELNIDQLMKQRPFMEKSLLKDEMLLGILLGFGRENARMYVERRDLGCTSNPFVWEKSLLYPQLYWSLVKSYLFLPREIRLGTKDITPPLFAGYPDSDESKQLKAKYLAARDKIVRYYKGKDFLEASLSLYLNGSAILE